VGVTGQIALARLARGARTYTDSVEDRSGRIARVYAAESENVTIQVAFGDIGCQHIVVSRWGGIFSAPARL